MKIMKHYRIHFHLQKKQVLYCMWHCQTGKNLVRNLSAVCSFPDHNTFNINLDLPILGTSLWMSKGMLLIQSLIKKTKGGEPG